MSTAPKSAAPILPPPVFPAPAPKKSWRSALYAILIIAVIIIAGIGVAQSVRWFPSASERLAIVAASVFSREERVIVRTDKSTVGVGETFDLSYHHVRKESPGSYSLRYACLGGVELALSSSTDAVPCGEWLELGSAGTSSEERADVPLTILTSDSRFADVTLDVEFVPETEGGLRVSGGTIVVAVNDAAPAEIASDATALDPNAPEAPAAPEAPIAIAPVTPITPVALPASTTTYVLPTEITPGPVTTRTYELSANGVPSNTPADLVPKLIAVGIIDKLTSQFVATSTLRSTDRIAVLFEVRNNGGQTVRPGWYFTAPLPTFPSYIFTSDGQEQLLPGAHIEFTLGFDSVSPYDNREVVINVDPNGSVGEGAGESNNILRVPITVTN